MVFKDYCYIKQIHDFHFIGPADCSRSNCSRRLSQRPVLNPAVDHIKVVCQFLRTPGPGLDFLFLRHVMATTPPAKDRRKWGAEFVSLVEYCLQKDPKKRPCLYYTVLN